jgi:hypothetical protein
VELLKSRRPRAFTLGHEGGLNLVEPVGFLACNCTNKALGQSFFALGTLV